VNAEWPDSLPTLTAEEAIRAARRLYRFAMKETFRGKVIATSGNRYTWAYRGTIRVNPDRGWRELVHHLSHLFDSWLSPATKPHASTHARLEMKLIKEVKRRGWLDGKLTRPALRKAAKADVGTKKLAHAKVMLKRAETRCKRADTILKKWRSKVRRAEKAVSGLPGLESR